MEFAPGVIHAEAGGASLRAQANRESAIGPSSGADDCDGDDEDDGDDTTIYVHVHVIPRERIAGFPPSQDIDRESCTDEMDNHFQQ